MSKRIPSVVIYCIDHITTYTANLSFQDFESNFMIIEACLYNIQIIGEAVAQLPDDVKNSNQNIPWEMTFQHSDRSCNLSIKTWLGREDNTQLSHLGYKTPQLGYK